MGYEDKRVLFKSLVQAFVPVSSTNPKKEAEQHICWFGWEIDSTCISVFVSNSKFQAVKSKWKGGCGSAEFTIHTSVQCCEVWTCLAWGDELNCFNKRIVGQWQEPLRQTRNWDQESKGGSAVGDQECSIRHRSMRKYPGSLINFYVMVYANSIAYFTMDSIVWNMLGAFAASCQIILYYRLMTQVVECGTSMFHHSFYWVVGDPITLCGDKTGKGLE